MPKSCRHKPARRLLASHPAPTAVAASPLLSWLCPCPTLSSHAALPL